MHDDTRPNRVFRFYPFDWIVVGYCLFMIALILLFGRPREDYYDEIVAYSFAAGLAALIAYYVPESPNRLFAFFRLLYPAILFTFFYRLTGGTMFLLHDGFLDTQLVAIEQSFLGIELTLFIDQHWLHTGINELFSFFYFTYYPMIPVFLLVLFFKERDDLIKSSVTAVLLTFFFSYCLFFLFPIEGPRWHFADVYQNPVRGIFFRPLVDYVIHGAAVRGGCMPSTHFAVAMVILMYLYRHYRKAAWSLLPIVIGLGAGTVWGRFHYLSDVIVGGLIAVLVTLLVWKQYDRWTGIPAALSKSKRTRPEHVS